MRSGPRASTRLRLCGLDHWCASSALHHHRLDLKRHPHLALLLPQPVKRQTDGSSLDSDPPTSTSSNLLPCAHTSISIHDSHVADAAGTLKSNPAAWSIIQADGSFGVLWVEPPHRGLGLGNLALKKCVSRLGTYCGFSGNQVTGTGILGWQWADASPVNARSIQFFSRQEDRLDCGDCRHSYRSNRAR